MRKVLTILFATLFTTGLWAQNIFPKNENEDTRIKKGTVILTGRFDLRLDNDDYGGDTRKVSNTSVDVSGDYAFNKTIAAGLGVGYTAWKTTDENSTPTFETSTTELRVAPKITAFGDVFMGWLQPTATFAVPIVFGERKTEGTNSKYTSFGATVSGGINIYLNKKLALFTSLGVLNYKNTQYKDSDQSTNYLRISLNPSNIGLGMRYMFGNE